MTIMVRMKDRTEWMSMIWELRKAGLLEGIGVDDISIPEERFPIEVPLNLDGLLELAGKPIVKPFRKKIDETLTKNIKLVKKGLC